MYLYRKYKKDDWNIQKIICGLVKIKSNHTIKKVYLFGMQIFSKNKPQIVETFYDIQNKIVNSIFTTSGITNELKHQLDYLYSSPVICNSLSINTWLIRLHQLILEGNERPINNFLTKYLTYYGYENLEKSLIVANYINNIEINNNSKIIASSKIFNNYKNNILTEYFKGKTIAIVGGSGCELGKGKGKEIDSHDVVIRFSNYPTDKKYIPDYGMKTNVWVRNFSPDLIHKPDISEYEKVIWHGMMDNRIFKEKHLSIMSEYINKFPNKLSNIPDEYYINLYKNYGIYRPTAGCALVWYLYNILGSLKNVDAYGFSFLNKDYNDTKHYFDDVCKIGVNHDMKLEIDLLHKLYNEDK